MVRRMMKEFERKVQIISPDLLIESKLKSDDILSFLNAGQDRYVKLVYSQDDEIVGETHAQKRNLDSIKSLLIQKKLTIFDLSISGHKRFILPTEYDSKYFLYVDSYTNVSGTYLQHPNEVKLENELIKPEMLDKYTSTADNKPIITKPGIVLMSDQYTKENYLIVAVDDYTTVNSIVLTYYRYPLRMSIKPIPEHVTVCELPKSVHDEIIDLAIDIFINEAKFRFVKKEN